MWNWGWERKQFVPIWNKGGKRGKTNALSILKMNFFLLKLRRCSFPQQRMDPPVVQEAGKENRLKTLNLPLLPHADCSGLAVNGCNARAREVRQGLGKCETDPGWRASASLSYKARAAQKAKSNEYEAHKGVLSLGENRGIRDLRGSLSLLPSQPLDFLRETPELRR